MDSLPFGGDEVDTLPLVPKELDLLATYFDEEEPEMPEATPVVPSQRLVDLRKKASLFSRSFSLVC